MYLFIYGQELDDKILTDHRKISEQAYVYGTLYKGKGEPFLSLKEPSCQVYGDIYEIEPEQFRTIQDDLTLEWTKAYLFDQALDVVTTTTASFPTEDIVASCDWKVYKYLNQSPMYYYAYGSCMDHERFEHNGVDHLFKKIKGGATLPNYKLGFTFHKKDGGRADILESSGDIVEGIVYEIEQEALDYLYIREGVHAKGYRPTIVKVHTHKGEALTCISFTVMEKKDDLPPPLHYAKEIHRGGTPYLSLDYMKGLERTFSEDLQVVDFKRYLNERD